MSLRKSTCLSSRRLDAARSNAQRSTGPRSEAGKQSVRMNAVKHGCDAAPENDAAVMRALGEDPKQYAALQQELATSYGPGDALWDQQLADLAKLYWRRKRLERMLTGRMREALEKLEAGRRELARALADVTFAPSQWQALGRDVPEPTHPWVRLRKRISLLGVILEQARQRNFPSGYQYWVEAYYKDGLSWRPKRISFLLGLLSRRAYYQERQDQAGLDQYVKESFGNEAGIEARCQELVRLLEEQLAREEAAFAEEMAAQERQDEIARDACLAPEDRTGEMLLRQETALDRSIDRKVRILLTMRKEHARWVKEASPPGKKPNGRGAEELSAAVGFDARLESPAEGKVRTRHAGPGLAPARPPRGAALQSKSGHRPAEENGGETLKSPEQSQNVAENKGSVAEEVSA